MRTCDQCGIKMPSFRPRRRQGEKLLCDGCHPEGPGSPGRPRGHHGLLGESDGSTVAHCPFCGSGSVVARSDGSVECGYCQSTFSVQVQPDHPFMPQTDPATGEPMPGATPMDDEQPGNPGQMAPVFTPPGAAAGGGAPAFTPPAAGPVPVGKPGKPAAGAPAFVAPKSGRLAVLERAAATITPESDATPWSVIKVVDTREFVEESGMFSDKMVPIPGTGSPRPCDRCARSHEIHVTVRAGDGKEFVVGKGCALVGHLELDGPVKAGMSAATTYAKNRDQVARLQNAQDAWNRAVESIKSMTVPESTIIPGGSLGGAMDSLATVDGKASIPLPDHSKADMSERRRTLESTWQDRVRRERYPELQDPSLYLASAKERLRKSEDKMRLLGLAMTGGLERRASGPKFPRPRDLDALQAHMEERHGMEVREGLAYQFEGRDPDPASLDRAIRRMHNEEHWALEADHDH